MRLTASAGASSLRPQIAAHVADDAINQVLSECRESLTVIVAGYRPDVAPRGVTGIHSQHGLDGRPHSQNGLNRSC